MKILSKRSELRRLEDTKRVTWRQDSNCDAMRIATRNQHPWFPQGEQARDVQHSEDSADWQRAECRVERLRKEGGWGEGAREEERREWVVVSDRGEMISVMRGSS